MPKPAVAEIYYSLQCRPVLPALLYCSAYNRHLDNVPLKLNYSEHSERSMVLQLCTCLEFFGSDPALQLIGRQSCTTSNMESMFDVMTVVQLCRPMLVMDQSNQNQLTVLSEVMTAVVFGLTGTHALHGCSTANSITI